MQLPVLFFLHKSHPVIELQLIFEQLPPLTVYPVLHAVQYPFLFWVHAAQLEILLQFVSPEQEAFGISTSVQLEPGDPLSDHLNELPP